MIRGRWRTRFASWVGDFTVAALRRELAAHGEPVGRNAVYEWLAGRTMPTASRAIVIVKVSRGRVRMEDILRHRSTVGREKGTPPSLTPAETPLSGSS